jgi:hypothetical protein
MAEKTEGSGGAKTAQAPEQGRVRWDTSQLKSSYCNIANATSTREEVIVNFGVNQNWERPRTELEVQLLHRIILSPYAAKRLQELLTKLIKEYEARYGVLK